MRSLGLLLIALLLLAGCGDDGPEPAAIEQSAGVTTPSPVAKPSGDTPHGQPPRDGPLPDTRTGGVPLGDTCPQEYDVGSVSERGLAVDALVESVEAGRVRFHVEEWIVGEGPDRLTLQMAPPQRSGMSESAPSYSVGTRLLVSGDDATAWGCGWTRYFDEETAAAWRS